MLLSIITINYNNAGGLEKTIVSVINQTHKNYEYIIVDGGSTDGSVDIIRQYSDQISNWISEPDKGIYNAMNKGIRNATGQYLLFLNSGDYFYNDRVIEKLYPQLADFDIIYGDVLFEENGESRWLKRINKPVTFDFFLYDNLPHQAAFIKKALFDTLGLYDETIFVCADWKFFVDSICKANASLKYVDMIIAFYDFTGISSNAQNWTKIYNEQRRLLERDYGRFIRDYDEFKRIRKMYNGLTASRIVKGYLRMRSVAKKFEILKKRLFQ